jgi:prephenate dehydratase
MEKNIKRVYTLGPRGTNCEKAAKTWLKSKKIKGEIRLTATLEEAVQYVKNDKEAALLSCIVYPDLHKLVFDNINSIEFFDCFVIDTYPMVLATRGQEYPRTISTHPAPENLIQPFNEIMYSTSNAQAALDCAAGKTEGCITTKECAEKLNLKIVKNFGELPMGFALHALKK